MSAPVTTSGSQPATPFDSPAATTVVDSVRIEHRAGFAVLCLVQFMLVVDIAVVNVALPSIRTDIAATPAALGWIVNAYTVVFGGLLVLGGRLADRIGRRQILLLGVTVFAIGSAVCAAAPNADILIAGRGLQGVGAALAAPSSLAIVTTIAPTGPQRIRALGSWSAVGAIGGAAGVLLGGVLTEMGWQLIFVVNLPPCALVLLVGRRLLPSDRGSGRIRGSALAREVRDVGLVSASLVGLVTALLWMAEPTAPWAIAACFAGAVGCATVVVRLQRAAHHPLIPVPLLIRGGLGRINLQYLLAAAATQAMIFELTLFMQSTLHYTPLQAGIGYLALTAPITAAALGSRRLAVRFGPRAVVIAGLGVGVAARLWLALVRTDTSFVAGLGPAMLLAGAGIGLTMGPLTSLAMGRAPSGATGVVTALLTGSGQVGTALGVSLASVAAAYASAEPAPVFLVTAALMAAALLLVVVRSRRQVSSDS